MLRRWLADGELRIGPWFITFTSHGICEVELIHLNLCKRNRATILNLLTSILCVWYSRLGSQEVPWTQPGRPGIGRLKLGNFF